MQLIGEKIIKIGPAVLENPRPQKDEYGAFEIEIKEAHTPAGYTGWHKMPDNLEATFSVKKHYIFFIKFFKN